MEEQEIQRKIMKFVKSLGEETEIMKYAYNRKEFIPGTSPVYYSGPFFDENEIVGAIQTILTGTWLAAGEEVGKFEKEYAKKFNQKHAVMVNSGSSANLVMIAALKKVLKWDDGDEIILSVIGFPTTLSSILINNLKPIFIDIEFDTLNFDFTSPKTYIGLLENHSDIINCIACTDTYSKDKQKHWDTNYKRVASLVDYCNVKNKKIIHISTDYIYAGSTQNATEEDVPVHNAYWYSYTKLLADGYVQLKASNYLLIRCTHKKTPFTYEYAYENVEGNFDTIDNIAPLIVQLIERDAKGVYNVGTETKTMFELAKKTKPDVKPSDVLPNITMPTDTTMNIEKMKNFLSIN